MKANHEYDTESNDFVTVKHETQTKIRDKNSMFEGKVCACDDDMEVIDIEAEMFDV